LRRKHALGSPGKALLNFETARKRRTPIDWKESDIAKPSVMGVQVLESFPLSELVPFIDWSPFFHTWELRGRYPSIFEHEQIGPKARELFDDAQKLLARIIQEKRFQARAVYGLF